MESIDGWFLIVSLLALVSPYIKVTKAIGDVMSNSALKTHSSDTVMSIKLNTLTFSLKTQPKLMDRKQHTWVENTSTVPDEVGSDYRDSDQYYVWSV